jgi:formate dehydrogenase assembly factor FdhD
MASIAMNPEFSLPLANAKNRQLQSQVCCVVCSNQSVKQLENVFVFVLQVREKRDKLAKLVQGLEQNESKIRNMEQELAALEQNCFQTAVSRFILGFSKFLKI